MNAGVNDAHDFVVALGGGLDENLIKRYDKTLQVVFIIFSEFLYVKQYLDVIVSNQSRC